MTETDQLNYIFQNKWNDKYPVRWCELCDTATISCLEKDCHGSTCNGCGCDKCRDDFKEFKTYKTTVFEYLTDEEKLVYRKALRIKDFIQATVPYGMKKLNWEKLDSEDQLSKNDQQMFLPEIYGKKPT